MSIELVRKPATASNGGEFDLSQSPQVVGGKFRLQFWVKVTGTGVTGTYSATLRNRTNTRTNVLTYSIPTAGVWTPITLDPTAADLVADGDNPGESGYILRNNGTAIAAGRLVSVRWAVDSDTN